MEQIDGKHGRGLHRAIASALIVLFSQIGFAATADDFDMQRYSTVGSGAFQTFQVDATQPLRLVLDNGTVNDDTMLLVTKTADGYLALMRDQMAFHHIAQGTAGGLEWMATF